MDGKLILSIAVLLFTFVRFSSKDTLAIGGSLIGAVIMTGVVVYSASYVIGFNRVKEEPEQITQETIDVGPIPVSLGEKSDNLTRTASKKENKYLSDVVLEEFESAGQVTDELIESIESVFRPIEGVGRIEIEGPRKSTTNTRIQLNIKAYDDKEDELMKVFIINGIAN